MKSLKILGGSLNFKIIKKILIYLIFENKIKGVNKQILNLIRDDII